jgi:hypothetical protein
MYDWVYRYCGLSKNCACSSFEVDFLFLGETIVLFRKLRKLNEVADWLLAFSQNTSWYFPPYFSIFNVVGGPKSLLWGKEQWKKERWKEESID